MYIADSHAVSRLRTCQFKSLISLLQGVTSPTQSFHLNSPDKLFSFLSRIHSHSLGLFALLSSPPSRRLHIRTASLYHFTILQTINSHAITGISPMQRTMTNGHLWKSFSRIRVIVGFRKAPLHAPLLRHIGGNVKKGEKASDEFCKFAYVSFFCRLLPSGFLSTQPPGRFVNSLPDDALFRYTQ